MDNHEDFTGNRWKRQQKLHNITRHLKILQLMHDHQILVLRGYSHDTIRNPTIRPKCEVGNLQSGAGPSAGLHL